MTSESLGHAFDISLNVFHAGVLCRSSSMKAPMYQLDKNQTTGTQFWYFVKQQYQNNVPKLPQITLKDNKVYYLTMASTSFSSGSGFIHLEN